MRTFLVVVVMLLLACALMAGFLMPVAGAQAPPAADLTVDCDGEAAAPSVATVRSCILKVANQGSAPVDGARVTFQPAPTGLIPDRYYFWDVRLDGRLLDTVPGQLTYELGNVPPGVTRTVELSVIVESAHPYTAMAVLSDAAGAQLAAATIVGRVTAPQPDLLLFVTHVITKDATGMVEPDPPGTYRLSMNLRNGTRLPIDSIDAAIEISGAAVDTSGGWRETLTRGGGDIRRYERAVSATSGDSTSIPVTIVGSADPCAVPRPVGRATVRLAGGRAIEEASFAEDLEFSCSPALGFGGGGDVTALPVGGDGGSDYERKASVVASMLLAMSAALAGASVVVLGVGRAARKR